MSTSLWFNSDDMPKQIEVLLLQVLMIKIKSQISGLKIIVMIGGLDIEIAKVTGMVFINRILFFNYFNFICKMYFILLSKQ